MKTIAYAALTAAVLVAGSSTSRVWAQPDDANAPQAADGANVRGQDDGSGPAGGPAARMMKRMQERLGLSDDQATKLQAAMQARRDGARAAADQMRTSMAKLRQQLDAKASDGDIKATLAQLREARRQMMAQEEKFADSVASFLTPTQQGKMLLGAMKMRGRRRGRGPEREDSDGPRQRGSDDRSNDD